MTINNFLNTIRNDTKNTLILGAAIPYSDLGNYFRDGFSNNTVGGSSVSCDYSVHNLIGHLLKEHGYCAGGVSLGVRNNITNLTTAKTDELHAMYARQATADNYLKQEKKIYLHSLYTEQDLTFEDPSLEDVTPKNLNTLIKTMRWVRYLNESSKELIYAKIYRKKGTNIFYKVSNILPYEGLVGTSKFNSNNLGAIKGMEDTLIYLSILPVLIPTLKRALTIEELDVFKQYGNLTTQDPLAAAIIGLINSEKYKAFAKEKAIAVVKQLAGTGRLTAVENRIVELNNELDKVKREYDNYLSVRQEQYKELLLIKASSFDEEVLNYLINHPYIADMEPHNMTGHEGILLTYRVPLTFWDEEDAEIILKNLDEHDRDRYETSKDWDITEVILQDIFSANNLTLWLSAQFFFSTEVKQFIRRWSNSVGSTLDQCQILNALPNGHQDCYSCAGDNDIAISQTHKAMDIIGLVEASMGATKNWNVADGTVFERMIEEIIPYTITHEIKCLEHKGKLFSFREYYQAVYVEGGVKDE